MKPVVLFVDDELPILKAIRRLFREAPYQVMTSPDPQAALELIPEYRPEVIVSDYRLPGMDGVTFLQEAERVWPDCVRILLTGYADVATAQEAINDARVFRFLTKPWKELELHGAIQSALFELERRREERSRLNAERESNQLLKSINESLQAQLIEKEGAMSDRERMLKTQFAATARGMLTALAERSPRLHAVAERTAFASGRIALLAGETWLRDTAVLAGLLHDIGYLALPDRLSMESRDLAALREHCDAGARLLESASYPPMMVEGVRHHHENWDASGPRGLKGTQIPFLSRCLRLADLLVGSLQGYRTFDSLPDEALMAVVDGALGRQIDPRLGALVIQEIKVNGARSFFTRQPPQLPEFEHLNLVAM